VDNAIEIRGLTKRYGEVEALSGVDLTVPRGSVTALLGMNGAGKTTLIRSVMGMLTPDAGGGTILGYSMGPGYPLPELKARIGYVGERPSLYEQLSGQEVLDFVRRLHRRWDTQTVGRYLDLFKLPMGRKVRGYSTGMRSQLALTLAMGGSPDLLVLDEPTVGLDPYHRNQYLQILLADAVEAGRTIFLTTHDLHQIERLADCVVILDQGRVKISASLDSLKEQTKRIRVAFGTTDQAEVAVADLKGVMRMRIEGRNRLLTIYGDPEMAVSTLRARPGFEGLQSYELSLEEIFLAAVAPD